MDDIVIVSAARTPVGSFSGALGTLSAHTLGTIALQAAFERANIEPGEVDEVILGQVLAAGEGQNPARQAARAAGVPDDPPLTPGGARGFKPRNPTPRTPGVTHCGKSRTTCCAATQQISRHPN